MKNHEEKISNHLNIKNIIVEKRVHTSMTGLITGKDTQEMKGTNTKNRTEIPGATTMMIKADEQTAIVTTTKSHKAMTNKSEDIAQRITHQSNETIHKKFMITMKHRRHKRQTFLIGSSSKSHPTLMSQRQI